MSNYVISGVVYGTDGTTPQATLSVTLRNESTNDTQTETTNSSGQYILDCANFDNGFSAGDLLTAFVVYSEYEASGSHTIVAGDGGATINLTLVAKIASGNLRYFAVQDFYDYFNFSAPTSTDSTTPTVQQVISVGVGVESEIDSRCGTKFDSNDGSYYSVTNEYHTVDDAYHIDFFLFKTPVVAVSSLQANASSEGETASWTTLTEDTDFELVNADTGHIKLTSTDNTTYPKVGSKQLRATYIYGLSSVPSDVKRLAILMTARTLARTASGRSDMVGNGEFNAELLKVWDEDINNLLDRFRRLDIFMT